MPTNPLNRVLQHLLADLRPEGGGMTDGELLARFLRSRDEDALVALVRRHTGMVWGVCRRLCRNHHDAEDAFQATFLVLVRKAADVPKERVANWLYGVARKTAVRSRATAAKRGRREAQVANVPEPTVPEVRDADLQRMVDEELSRLPGHYRGVVILCDLEDMTRREAARQLGIPEGSVASRLARARAMLAKRLNQRGIVLSGSVAVVLSAGLESSSAPPALVASTIKAASLMAAGQAASVVSAKVAALTEGVLKTMFLTKLKIAAVVVLLVASLTGGTGLIYHTQAAQNATGKEKERLTVKRADEPASEKGDETPELQRRIAQLEKQLQALTRKVEALQKKLDAAPAKPPDKAEAKAFHLRHSSVDEVSQMLWDLFREKKEPKVRIGKDSSTNAIVAVGSPNDLRMIEEIVAQLEKLPKKGENKGKVEK